MLFTLISVSTEMVPTVPKEIGLNIKELLTVYSCGIRSELIPKLYKVCIHMYKYVCIFRPVHFIPNFFFKNIS